MNLRELIGLLCIVAGLAITPVARMFSRTWWLIAFVLVAIGAVLFYTERMARREAELEKHGAGGSGSPGVPGDVHNYSGWRTGGRSATMDGAESSDAD